MRNARHRESRHGASEGGACERKSPSDQMPSSSMNTQARKGRAPARKNFDHSVGYVQRSLLTSQTPLIHSTRPTYDATPIPDDRGTYHLRFVVPWSVFS
jgi:hypothetical protein